MARPTCDTVQLNGDIGENAKAACIIDQGVPD